MKRNSIGRRVIAGIVVPVASPPAVILLINTAVRSLRRLTLINDHQTTAFSHQYCRLEKHKLEVEISRETSAGAVLAKISNSMRKTIWKCHREIAFKRCWRWRSARGLCFWKITRGTVAWFGNIELMWFISAHIASNILQKSSSQILIPSWF